MPGWNVYTEDWLSASFFWLAELDSARAWCDPIYARLCWLLACRNMDMAVRLAQSEVCRSVGRES